MSKENEGYTVEQAYEDLQKGIELGIVDLVNKLNNSLENLSKGEMERALGSIINYPDGVKVYHKKEEEFIKNLVALHGLHIQAQIQAIGELQQEHDEKLQGESNV